MLGGVMKILIVGLLVVVTSMFSPSTSTLFAQEVDYCEGNFDYDQDVDGTDAAVFKDDFGRSTFDYPCPPPNPAPSLVPKTGQTTSSATGDDGDLEKGVPWPNPRFIDNGDGTITDNLTGLIWLKDANCFGQRTWYSAMSDSNGLADGSCGLTDGSNVGDWRLPNSNELASLIHKGYYNPAVPNTAGTGHWSEGDPFINLSSSIYWSSTNAPYFNNGAWFVFMDYGVVSVDLNKETSLFRVWPVRGGQ